MDLHFGIKQHPRVPVRDNDQRGCKVRLRAQETRAIFIRSSERSCKGTSMVLINASVENERHEGRGGAPAQAFQDAHGSFFLYCTFEFFYWPHAPRRHNSVWSLRASSTCDIVSSSSSSSSSSSTPSQ